jgi:hypothetical protein
MDYKKILTEFMCSVQAREGDYFVKDVIAFDVEGLTREEYNALYELYREI